MNSTCKLPKDSEKQAELCETNLVYVHFILTNCLAWLKEDHGIMCHVILYLLYKVHIWSVCGIHNDWQSCFHILIFILLSQPQTFVFIYPCRHMYNYPVSVLGPVSNLPDTTSSHSHLPLGVSSQSFWDPKWVPGTSQLTAKLPRLRQVNGLCRREENVCVSETPILTQVHEYEGMEWRIMRKRECIKERECPAFINAVNLYSRSPFKANWMCWGR